jgi:hypothetical protein
MTHINPFDFLTGLKDRYLARVGHPKHYHRTGSAMIQPKASFEEASSFKARYPSEAIHLTITDDAYISIGMMSAKDECLIK